MRWQRKVPLSTSFATYLLVNTIKASPDLAQKMARLRDILSALGKVTIAFSGGVDSMFLLSVACRTLGNENVLAVTATGPVYAQRERSFAQGFAHDLGLLHVLVPMWDLAKNGPYINHPDRCFECKTELFTKVIRLARGRGFLAVADGTNVSDLGDYRPGLRAIKELLVRSPLLDASLEKEEIRALSREMGLPMWDRPAMACLASRFPYGALITEEALEKVERAEELLQDRGFQQVRVRHHGDLARIEVVHDEMPRLLSEAGPVISELKSLSYRYVTMDLLGYRMGSMNEILPLETIKHEAT